MQINFTNRITLVILTCFFFGIPLSMRGAIFQKMNNKEAITQPFSLQNKQTRPIRLQHKAQSFIVKYFIKKLSKKPKADSKDQKKRNTISSMSAFLGVLGLVCSLFGVTLAGIVGVVAILMGILGLVLERSVSMCIFGIAFGAISFYGLAMVLFF